MTKYIKKITIQEGKPLRGAPPKPQEALRVMIAARVTPATSEIVKGSHLSTGRFIDMLVDSWLKTREK